MIRIFRAEEYIEWFEQQTEKSKVQIDYQKFRITNTLEITAMLEKRQQKFGN